MSSSKPFSTCEYCNRICEFRVPASAVTESQKTYVINSYAELRDGKLGTLVKLSMLKACATLNKPFDAMNMDQRSLAYCLVAHIIKELDLDDPIKNTVMKNTKKILLDMFKRAAQMPTKEPTIQEAAPDTSGESIYHNNSLVKDGVVQIKSDANGNPIIDSDTINALRQQAREKQALQQKIEGPPKGKTDQAYAIRDIVWNWINSDTKFMKIVKDVKQIESGFIIEYDPNSPGYIQKFKVQFAKKTFNLGDAVADVTKLRTLSTYDVAYNMDAAIGFGKKEITCASFYGLPSEQAEIIKGLENVNPKKIGDDWDQLMVILNNDKKLRQNVEKLPLKSPLKQYVEDIVVPVTIKHEGNQMNITITTFFDEKIKPSDLFLNVQEKIAEDLDNLHDIDQKQRGKMVGESGLFEFNAPESSSTNFHFLGSSEPITVPTCPNCGRPFPDPEAEYRRCPYCLFKLM